jgi:hypothetical protein
MFVDTTGATRAATYHAAMARSAAATVDEHLAVPARIDGDRAASGRPHDTGTIELDERA